ncbi:MAG TPA: SpoIIE family protein phosphatase [Nocardioides sp.]|nr:SpoIIE family protein phosphatase [Nocardioides sp.]
MPEPVPPPATLSAQADFEAALLEDDPELLYDRAPCGYLSTTPDGLIVKVNQTLLTWTGLDRDELVGRRTFAELLTVGGRIYHETHYAPMLRLQGEARAIALDVRTSDGGVLPVLVNAVLERDAEGSARVVRVVIFDATDRREYERELLRAKQRAEESESRARRLAETLQQTLIPPLPPSVPGLDVAAAYRPAGRGHEVGGDFYDVFQIGENDWVVVLGDVCGKGIEAAVVTALVRYTVRAVSVQTADPAEALERLDEILLARGSSRYCTLVLARLRCADDRWTVTLSLGGHPLPLHLVPGRAPETVGRPGAIVGVLEAVDRSESEVPLAPGEALVFYTDGVTEGRRGRELYGEDRLHRVLDGAEGAAPQVVSVLLADVLAFQDGLPRDDVAVVVVKVPEVSAG